MTRNDVAFSVDCVLSSVARTRASHVTSVLPSSWARSEKARTALR
jgi:hypothetical protein